MAEEDDKFHEVREEDDGSAVVLLDEAEDKGKQTGENHQENGEQHAEDGAAEDEHKVNGETDAEEAAELANAKSESEREKIRERRRRERKNKKQQQKDNFEQLQRQLDAERRKNQDLEGRLNVIERKSTGAELAQLDHAIKQNADAYEYFKNIHSEAVSKQDGKTATEAAERMAFVRQRDADLKRAREGFVNGQKAPRPLDEDVTKNATNWMGENRWYNPAGADIDSRIVMQIDAQLVNEGWDPKTKDYWDELTERSKKYIPHRFSVAEGENKGENNQKNRRRSVVTGSGGESGGQGGGRRVEFKLSPERVSAIKEAGHWNDPEKRKKAIQYYRDYDAKNA